MLHIEERFRNKRVRGKDNVTKNPSQYEKENSEVAIRSKEKAGNKNKPIDISDSTLVKELSKTNSISRSSTISS